MRRTDREVTNFDEIVKIVEKCDICRLALADDDVPYIIPLNFGFTIENSKLTLYFHGSDKGKKHELIKKNNHASFEMDCSHQLILSNNSCTCTMNYESVVGSGIIEYVDNAQKQNALLILMNHYYSDKSYNFNENMLSKTTVFKLTVSKITGKKHS